nr:hypothetical protein [Tanacetum cinerariifolium]
MKSNNDTLSMCGEGYLYSHGVHRLVGPFVLGRAWLTKSKIKIIDYKHAEGTAKNSQDNKVLRLDVKMYEMTTP